MLGSAKPLKKVAKRVYNYHNLGVGVFPEGEEKTPYGSGERYNFDRMQMMVSNYDFTNKSILDIGCNSGWFCFQAKLLGANKVCGIDYEDTGIMGGAIHYAKALEKKFRLGMQFYNCNVEKVDFKDLCTKNSVPSFDVILLLSVLHHIQDKQGLLEKLYANVNDVIFYEDHEFWNEMYDEKGEKIAVKGEGFRFGWNEDLSWQRKICGLEKYEEMILDAYKKSWRWEVLLMDSYEKILFLGFSEKRRPLFAFYKKNPEIT